MACKPHWPIAVTNWSSRIKVLYIRPFEAYEGLITKKTCKRPMAQCACMAEQVNAINKPPRVWLLSCAPTLVALMIMVEASYLPWILKISKGGRCCDGSGPHPPDVLDAAAASASSPSPRHLQSPPPLRRTCPERSHPQPGKHRTRAPPPPAWIACWGHACSPLRRPLHSCATTGTYSLPSCIIDYALS